MDLLAGADETGTISDGRPKSREGSSGSNGSGDAAGVEELITTGSGSTTGSGVGVVVGWMGDEGMLPVGANAGLSNAGVSCGAWLGVSGTGVATGGRTMASERSLEESNRELDGGGTDVSASSDDEGSADETTGGGCKSPVPAGSSEVVVTMTSRVDVSVLAESKSLLRMSCPDDVSELPPNTKDKKSGN